MFFSARVVRTENLRTCWQGLHGIGSLRPSEVDN